MRSRLFSCEQDFAFANSLDEARDILKQAMQRARESETANTS
jgi:hypothetical protein